MSVSRCMTNSRVTSIRSASVRSTRGCHQPSGCWVCTYQSPIRSVQSRYCSSPVVIHSRRITGRIAQLGIDSGEQAVALGVFIVMGTLGPAAPVALYFALGERAAAVLDDLKGWMGAHNAAIMAVLCLVIGAKLIGDGISGLG